MNIRAELEATNEGLDRLIEHATLEAQAQGIDPHRAMYPNGQLILASLLTAKANALAALVMLDQP